MNTTVRFVVLVCGGLALSACTQSTLRLSPDFGVAVRQDADAQIMDPDAHYAGMPAPGSAGTRVGLAQKRYDKNQVVQPTSVTASGQAADLSGSGQGMGETK
jgi:hypothetical protein